MADNVKGGLQTALYVLVGLALANPAQAQTWQVGTAPSFLTGSYGTGADTDIFYAPVTAKRLFKDGDVALVVPYLCVTGATDVTIVGDSAIRTGSTGVRDTAATRPARGSTATTPTTTPATPAVTVQRRCGLGDVVLRGRYYLLDERAWFPTIAVRAHVKTPTADADRGLGTGRPDEGVGLEITRSVGGGLSAMADGGYTVIGRPEGVEFNRPWWYDVGLGQDLARGAVNVSVFFEQYQAIVPGLPNARDMLAALTLKGRGWQAQLAAQFGASDGAAERGFTVGISRRF
ncbi:MAG TPA: transporter [Vicinamibacterales bacterium]|nr:transporter [Vicinamibacterales bacterium]